MEVIRLTTFDNETVQQVDGLLHMLSPQSQPVESIRLKSLIKEGRLHLFVCRDDNAGIIGMLTLTCCPTLASDKYWIEDVIVDEAFRGQGAGRALLRAAVGYAPSGAQGIMHISDVQSVQSAGESPVPFGRF